MSDVGVCGGHSILCIGTEIEMKMFFDAIAKYSRTHDPYTDYNVILDRLYKRYLRLEELGTATTLLNRIKDIFAKIIVPQEYLDFAIRNDGSSSFNLKANNLAEFFANHIISIHSAIETAIYCYESSIQRNKPLYQMVMICHTNTVPCTIASMRPNELYDKLEGDPYWMREPVMDWDPKDYPRK